MRLKSVIAALVLCVCANSAFAQQPSTTIVKPAKQIDSVWNGVLIGAGAGAVGAWIFTRANCGPRGYDDECAAIAGLVGVATFIPGGMLVGGVVDRLINKTLPPGATARTTLAPVLSQSGGKKNVGMAFKLKIRF